MEHAYSISAQEALKYFQVKQSAGLSDIQVLKSRDRYGANSKLPRSLIIWARHAKDIFV